MYKRRVNPMENLAHCQDYRVQLAQSLRTPAQIAAAFPAIPKERIKALEAYAKGYRFQLTPYLLSTLDLDAAGRPAKDNPLADVFFPEPTQLLEEGSGAYSPELMNWELPSDFVVEGRPAFQLKYTDRLLYRASGCLSICSYCFEAHRVVDKTDPKKPQRSDWGAGMAYLRVHPEIREFIMSGGDPLLASDERLETQLRDLRSIPSIETIRIHSAVLMHCPMRITDELVRIFKRYEVTELGVHVVHPRQITDEFISALHKFDDGGYGSHMKLAQIPLLAGVNDNATVLHELLTKLERHRVKAYYLLHGLPWTLGAAKFRTPVYHGVETLRPLYRTLSHIAWPEYVIVARGGKATVPLERNDFWLDASLCTQDVWAIDDTRQPLASFASEERNGLLRFAGTPEFIYTCYRDQPVIVFRNWKGTWEMYLDG